MIVPLAHILMLALALFGIGLVGVFVRRDAVSIFLSVEVLLNAANVAFIGFAYASGNELGHVAAFVVIAVAAAEAAIGLALVLRLNARHGTLHLKKIKELRG